MITDWILIRRAAVEIERAIRGGRIVDAGLLDDGRFGLRFGGRRGGGETVLAFDIFGSPPVPALEETELSLAGDPGWAKSLALPLRGLRAGAVRSRPGDRVLVLDLGTTSRFGVSQGVKLVAELIPRFGNLLLVRDGLIIAAAKQFSPAENEARSVGVGGPYRPPPLGAPSVGRLISASLAAQADALPWTRSHFRASSMSPSQDSRAFLASRNPTPVAWRSACTSFAVNATLFSSLILG